MGAELVQAGVYLDHTPGTDVVGGDVVAIDSTNNFFGVAPNDIAANSLGTLAIAGVYRVKKIPATAMAAGLTVGFDLSADQAVLTADGDSDGDIGRVAKAAGASDTHVDILLNGLPA